MLPDPKQVYGDWGTGRLAESIRYERLDLSADIRRIHVCRVPPTRHRARLTYCPEQRFVTRHSHPTASSLPSPVTTRSSSSYVLHRYSVCYLTNTDVQASVYTKQTIAKVPVTGAVLCLVWHPVENWLAYCTSKSGLVWYMVHQE